MSLESECWLAATGVIAPNATAPSPARVGEIPLRLNNRITRWIKGSEVKAWTPPKYHDPEKLRDRFVHTPDSLPGALELGDTLGAEWVHEVADARQSLLARWPGIPLRGGLTELEPPLAHDAAQDWLGLVAIVEDVFRVCDELEAGALLPAAWELFVEVYPDLTGVVTDAAFRAVVDLAANPKRTDLPESKERGIRQILGTPPEEPIVVSKPEEPPPPPAEHKTTKGTDLRTVSQKAASAGEG